MRSTLLAGTAVVVAALLGGCASNGSGAADPASTTTTARPSGSSTGGGGNTGASSADAMPAALRFVRCLRRHGLDVQVGADGSPVPAGGPVLETSQGPVAGSGRGSGGTGIHRSGQPSTTSLDPAAYAAAKAACAKEVPDYVEPSSSGG